MRNRRPASVAFVLAAALMLPLGQSATAAVPPRLPGAPDCPVFPQNNVWNKRVDGLPVIGAQRR